MIKVIDKVWDWCAEKSDIVPGLLFSISGFLLIVYLSFNWLSGCLIDMYTDGRDIDQIRNIDKVGQIGDSFGGTLGPIMGLLAAVFGGLAFWAQYRANEQQREEIRNQDLKSKHERIETRFFDMVKMHRENVSELFFDGTKLVQNSDSLFIEDREYSGKAVFLVFFYQFVMCRNELMQFFRPDKIYQTDYKEKLSSLPYIREHNLDLTQLAKIDICYSIVYYGVGTEGRLILEKIFKHRYKDVFINNIIQYISLKPARDASILEKWILISKKHTRTKKKQLMHDILLWREFGVIPPDPNDQKVVVDFHNRYIKFYGGHQFRLGHYYRHLFQIVKFINNEKNLDYQSKYEYLKVLRAQLSTYEQAFLFLNSLSSMGHPWELDPPQESGELINRKDNELITKYNLIKNIPGDTLYGIHFKNFYPGVQYESSSELVLRYKYS